MAKSSILNPEVDEVDECRVPSCAFQELPHSTRAVCVFQVCTRQAQKSAGTHIVNNDICSPFNVMRDPLHT